MKLTAFLVAAGLAILSPAALASPLSISLNPASTNPSSPQMGDNLKFQTVIQNNGTEAVDGLIAWISLVQVDKGKEQPVDLEDWSAHKAVTASSLASGGSIKTDWPMRLIQSGNYRVIVSAATRSGQELATSPFSDFTVRQKPVVESGRVLPIALGIPVLIGAGMVLQRRRRAHKQ
ncbi:hypothetical protein [Roseibium aggregatum]|uniref:Secreted protein n=1 Tax=Roseibium aggregatum TaxID=187304 RepID=A0A926S968_9HYPH|nr:hypothetical protein [Roseibium aggregatum]MBD1546249.1 hypothetical protein [Roseibium aggregatum]